VRAWGYNRQGQLGNGTMASSAVPVKVAGLSQVTGISAGYDASMATRTSGIAAITSVWTWGGNAYGQLGHGSTAQVTGPVQVTGLTNATQMAAGRDFSLAVHTVPFLLGS
jgi:alpha-tubulin suppressor-like RCC1 family protein